MEDNRLMEDLLMEEQMEQMEQMELKEEPNQEEQEEEEQDLVHMEVPMELLLKRED